MSTLKSGLFTVYKFKIDIVCLHGSLITWLPICSLVGMFTITYWLIKLTSGVGVKRENTDLFLFFLGLLLSISCQLFSETNVKLNITQFYSKAELESWFEIVCCLTMLFRIIPSNSNQVDLKDVCQIGKYSEFNEQKTFYPPSRGIY